MVGLYNYCFRILDSYLNMCLAYMYKTVYFNINLNLQGVKVALRPSNAKKLHMDDEETYLLYIYIYLLSFL